jgi:hypothetical protein
MTSTMPMSSFAGENEGDERSAFYAAAWRARGFGPSRWVGGRPTCPAPAPGQRIENELARAQLDRRSVPSEFRPRPLPSGLNPPKSARIRGYQPSLDGGVSGLLEPVLRLFCFLRDVSPEREVASSNLAGRISELPANDRLVRYCGCNQRGSVLTWTFSASATRISGRSAVASTSDSPVAARRMQSASETGARVR